MSATLSEEEIREVNTRYHDLASEHYDAKWGIDFGDIGRTQVLAKVRKALGREPGRYARSLEIGAGTGYFTLNMIRAGIIEQGTCTDISAGMLRTLRANAESLGLPVQTVQADAERLPFPDSTFDLLFGHAVLHHIPDLPAAFREFARVLAPGGTLLFAGEPSRHGDRLARIPKRLALAAAPLWRRAMRASPVAAPAEDANGTHGSEGARGAERAEGLNGAEGAHGAGPAHGSNGLNGTPGAHGDRDLEGLVDIHAFDPSALEQLARSAHFQSVRVTGEELLANWFGWTNRTLESTAEPQEIPWAWRQYAYRGYLLLQEFDARLLEPRLPPAIFYNLMLSARSPEEPGPGDPAPTRSPEDPGGQAPAESR